MQLRVKMILFREVSKTEIVYKTFKRLIFGTANLEKVCIIISWSTSELLAV